ncbi:hypothetical protein [Puniceibacterium sp. IMCC21224]|uniref:hypothetical protein n=1 Tax=Puniceibacterium sp. IMCC21224 TaxID=1618204 RepID=UPI0012DFEFE9|nr:hypothetical protein [Puniceibacterium sp. IMCC21224]
MKNPGKGLSRIQTDFCSTARHGKYHDGRQPVMPSPSAEGFTAPMATAGASRNEYWQIRHLKVAQETGFVGMPHLRPAAASGATDSQFTRLTRPVSRLSIAGIILYNIEIA